MRGLRWLVSISSVRAQTSASSRSGLRPLLRPSAAKSHIWNSSSAKFADVGDAALCVERRDRLGAQVLAFRGVDLLDRQVRVDGAEHLDDEIAALVGLDDDAVRPIVMIGGDGGVRPDRGLATLDGAITDDVAAPVDAETSDDDAAAVRAGSRGDRRIDGDDDAPQLGARGEPAGSSH